MGLYLSTILLACFGLIAYLYSTLHSDGDYGSESNRPAALWRRLYLLVACLAGLTLVLWGATSLLSALLENVFDQSAMLSVSGGLATLERADYPIAPGRTAIAF